MSKQKQPGRKRRAAGSEQVERATGPGPEPDTRHDARGERVPEPYPESGGDEPDEEVLERHRRGADRLEQHGDDEADHPQR